VPVAAFGVLWFALNLAVSVVQIRDVPFSGKTLQRYVVDDALFMAQIVWLVLGLLSVVYFVYAEIVIGAICPFCTVVHVDIILQIFVLRSCASFRRKQNPGARWELSPIRLCQGAWRWIVSAVGLSLLLLVLFNSVMSLDVTPWELGPAVVRAD